MSTKRWRHLITHTRTARSWRIPITVILGYREDAGLWSDQDKIMAVALQQYEDSVHSVCGVPASVAFGDDNVGRVEWVDSQCHACAAHEEATKNDNEKYPGKILSPTWDDDGDDEG